MPLKGYKKASEILVSTKCGVTDGGTNLCSPKWSCISSTYRDIHLGKRRRQPGSRLSLVNRNAPNCY
jgi:hypothetical protein